MGGVIVTMWVVYNYVSSKRVFDLCKFDVNRTTPTRIGTFKECKLWSHWNKVVLV